MNPPPASRRRRLLRNLALSLATFLLCGAVCEGVLRLLGYGNLEVYQPDPRLYWRLKPSQNCYTKVDHKPVHINSLGTRGPEFSPAKPAGTFRILSLGDSRTFGWGLSEPETYSGRLQQLLRQQAGKTQTVEVLNAGVNAWSYPQMLVYFRDTALAYHPDVVILAEANLWTQFSERNSPEFVRKFMSRVRLKNLLRRFALYHFVVEMKLNAFYERYRVKFIPVDPQQDSLFREQQQKDPEALFRSAIEDLCALAVSNKVQPLLLYLPAADELGGTNLNPILRVKRAASQRFHAPLVDPTPDLQPAGHALYLEGDALHLNARGNEIIARRLYETMNRLSLRR